MSSISTLQSNFKLMDNILYDQLLFDYYGALLTENQQKILKLYYEENFTLTEISQKTKTSRQAVHDTLKRAHKSLENYEEQLGLIATDRERQKILDEAKSSLKEIIESNCLEQEDRRLNKIIDLLDNLY